MNQTIVITDTSCLIILDKIGALALLPLAFSNIIVTPEIAAEFQKPLPAWIMVKQAKNAVLLDTYCRIVDLGEASAITLALELPYVLLVLDDLKGRKLAKQLELPVTGTVGLLVRLREQSHIISLRPYFEAIKVSDFRIDHRLLDHTLDDFND